MPATKPKKRAKRKPIEERDHDVVYGGFELFVPEAAQRINASVFSGLTHTPIRRAIHILSSYVAKLPISLYRRDDSGDTTEVTDHPVWWMLKRKPSPYYTPFTFFYSLMLNALWCGRGNGYAYIYRDGAGRPSEVLLLDPINVTVVRERGQVWYLTAVQAQGENGTPELRRLPAADVLHIRSLTTDGVSGLDIIRYNADATLLGLALRQHGLDFFLNGAVPGVVIERPPEAGKLNASGEEALRRRFEAIHVGIGKHHRTAILQEGAKASVISVDAQKSQMIEQRKFDILEVANLFGVPPHKLGATDRTSYASLEQENQAFLDDGLDPWLVQVEQECSDKLLSESERRSGMYCEYNREVLMRANTADKFNGFNIALQSGFMNRDEVRRKLNLNKIPGGLGETYYMPLNMAPLGGSQQDDNQPDAPADIPVDDAARARYIADVAKRIRRRMAKAVNGVNNRAGFAWLVSHLSAQHSTAIGSAIAPLVPLGVPGNNATDGMIGAIGDDLRAIMAKDGDYKANLAAWAASDAIHRHLTNLLGVGDDGTTKTPE